MKKLEINILLERPGFSFSMIETFLPGITGIFGQSGAGKTTLLQCISGVETPKSGEIKMGDKFLYSHYQRINTPIHKRRVAYVFQEGRLFPHYSVRKNLQYGRRFLNGCKNIVDFQSVVAMLEIGHLLEKYPADISGGERQRVALGRALLSSPDVLLLDEPFSALDQKLRQQIIPFIKKIASKLQLPVLVVSHDLPDILKLTDRLCLIQSGSVVGHDTYTNLLQSKAMLKVLPAADIINTFKLEVKEIEKDKGLIRLNGMGAGRSVNIVFEPRSQHYQLGDKVKVFLKPDDIILSKNTVEGISSRNQIKGVVNELIAENPRVLCKIDCGFPLMVEVSKAAAHQLNLQTGSEVYCLFKTLALDSVSV